MPKAISVPAPIPKEIVPASGVVATVLKARIVRDQYTSIGNMKFGLGLTVDVLDGEYSQLFSLDKDPLTGSIGRMLVAVGMNEIDEKAEDKDVQVFVGKQFTIRKRSDKLYWYP